MLRWSPKIVKVDRNTSELWQIVYRNLILTLVQYGLHLIIRGNCGGWGCTDSWETRIIQNIYFIELWTDNSSPVCLLYVVIYGLSLKELVCCTDSFVRALGGKSHYCPHSLLGISNLRSRKHNRENTVQIMRNTTSTYLCTNMTFKQRRSCEHVFRSCEKKSVIWNI
jgi:hypothetical protein